MDSEFNLRVYEIKGMHMVRLDDVIDLMREIDKVQSSSNAIIDMTALVDYLQDKKENYDEY